MPLLPAPPSSFQALGKTLPSQARNADVLHFANANLAAAEWVGSEQGKDISEVLVVARKDGALDTQRTGSFTAHRWELFVWVSRTWSLISDFCSLSHVVKGSGTGNCWIAQHINKWRYRRHITRFICLDYGFYYTKKNYFFFFFWITSQLAERAIQVLRPPPSKSHNERLTAKVCYPGNPESRDSAIKGFAATSALSLAPSVSPLVLPPALYHFMLCPLAATARPWQSLGLRGDSHRGRPGVQSLDLS